MINKWTRKKKIYFILCEIIALFFLVAIGFAIAQTTYGEFTISADGKEFIQYTGDENNWNRIAFIGERKISSTTVSNWPLVANTYNVYKSNINPLSLPTAIAHPSFTFDLADDFNFYLTSYKTPCIDFEQDGPASCDEFELIPINYISGTSDTSVWEFADVLQPDTSVVFDTNFQTRFTNGIISGASSTTVNAQIDYFLETSEFNALNRPDAININILEDNLFSGDQQIYSQKQIILPLTNGTSTKNINFDFTFEDGVYIAFVNFFNINTNNLTFPLTGITIKFEIDNGIVITSVIEQITNGQGISQNIEVYQDCSFSNIYGCFVNALVFVFVPAPTSLDRFTTLWQQVETKPPFGYVTSVINELSTMSTTTEAFSFGTIPFKEQFFDPFKILLATGLWAIYGFWFMGRLSKLDI